MEWLRKTGDNRVSDDELSDDEFSDDESREENRLRQGYKLFIPSSYVVMFL